MNYLLDSNVVISLMRGVPVVVDRLRRHSPSEFGMSAIVAHELFYGAHKGSRVAANLARVEAMQVEVVEFDAEDARRAGELRAALAKAGTPLGPYDVLIAGQALARGLTLITHNTREFNRVEGLVVEDWE